MRRGTAAGAAVLLLAAGLSAASARVAAAAWQSQATATATFGVGTFAGPVPRIAKSFTPDVQTAGQPVRLVFTVYNSSPPTNAYVGHFEDRLPSGMQIASPANFAITCPNGGGNAVPGPGNAISFSLALNTATASCTIAANVTGTPGTYVNGQANLTQNGQPTTLPVNSATVRFS